MIRVSNKLLASGAALVLVGGTVGFGVARLAAPSAQPVAPAKTTSLAKESEPRIVKLTDEAVKSSAIGTEVLTRSSFVTEVTAQATVVAKPNGEAVLTSRVPGTVTRLFKRLGDPVRAGELIAIIESREAGQVAADRASAAAKETLARRNLAREKSLYDQRVSPRVDYERAEAEATAAGAETRRALTAASAVNVTRDGRGVMVKSPISGRISVATARLGAFVQGDVELFRVADPRLIQVEAAVSGGDSQRLHPGDRALVEAADGSSIEARVRSVSPSLGSETRSAVAVLDIASGALLPGQAVRARLFPRDREQAQGFVVPEEAVQTIDGHDAVFVRTREGFRHERVVVTRRSARQFEISGPLSPGQSIATKNAFLLKAELGKSAGEEG